MARTARRAGLPRAPATHGAPHTFSRWPAPARRSLHAAAAATAPRPLRLWRVPPRAANREWAQPFNPTKSSLRATTRAVPFSQRAACEPHCRVCHPLTACIALQLAAADAQWKTACEHRPSPPWGGGAARPPVRGRAHTDQKQSTQPAPHILLARRGSKGCWWAGMWPGVVWLVSECQ